MPVSINLKSKYYESVGKNPHSEYPRPQLERDSYLNLNGMWDYAILKKGETPTNYQGEILVPFSPESLLSGVNKTVYPDNVLFYKRTFKVPEDFINERTILHFTAVDYACAVFLNGKVVGTHRGGYVPFSFDVTNHIKPGKNEIRLEVTDPTDHGYGSKGKQKLKSGNIWYTPQSGIWGTVWMESISKDAITDLTIIPDIDQNQVKVTAVTTSETVTASVYDHTNRLAEVTQENVDGKVELTIPLSDYELWSPENPKLYTLKLRANNDFVTSYFGMRKFEVGRDQKGIRRLMLNNKPYFHTGVLDQGYWSDGKLTPPSDQAMIDDITMLKDMGFNMIRKHIKIEPLRWYYHCDRLGMLVWQDMVNGGEEYNPLVTMVLPFLGINLKDNFYKIFGRQNIEGRKEYILEAEKTVNLLKNSVSLAMWVPFNEGWGQFDSNEITNMIRHLDPTRTIDSTSGWHDQKSGDFVSKHIYFTPIYVPRDDRCYLLSEFGGFSKPSLGHMYSPTKFFGYRVYTTKRKLQKALSKLYTKSITKNIPKGLSASVYTQLSDVEEEINGLITYDRKQIKVDPQLMRQLNEQAKAAINK